MRRPTASLIESIARSHASVYELKCRRMSQGALRQLLLRNPMEPALTTEPIFSPPPTAMDLPLQLQQSNEPLEALSIEEKTKRDRERYSGMRLWKRLRKEKPNSTSQDSFILRMISFNILAQNLLESYQYLYKDHDKRALPWERRQKLILDEILEAQADIICLQEMQQEHLPGFLRPFVERGYNHIYKKRTNDKQDGLLLLYRSENFLLVEQSRLELYQSGIERLSRDNVAIVAKFAVKSNPDIQLVVATTHLLYNPKRNDVRLGQTQLLLAEIERIAYVKDTMTGAKYLPIILSGDFNLEPFTGVYRFITEGSFEYQGKGRNLEEAKYRCLSNSLIPPRLCVTDNCQHLNVLLKRLRGQGTGKVMLEHSECSLEEDLQRNSSVAECGLNTESLESQSVEITRGQHATFSSGTLSHPFRFKSVYTHMDEATTNQGNWITVDYMFHTDDIATLERYTLPTVQQCTELPTIPNFVVGSDHLCLGASFKLFKRNLS